MKFLAVITIVLRKSNVVKTTKICFVIPHFSIKSLYQIFSLFCNSDLLLAHPVYHLKKNISQIGMNKLPRYNFFNNTILV